MKKPNAYLQKQEEQKQFILNAGMDTGFQKRWDLMQVCLRDPEFMGKDIFGRERIKKLYQALKKYEKEFGKAWLPSMHNDADVCQRNLDAKLGEVWGDELCPFKERYPYVRDIDYSKGRKEWKR